MSEAEAVSEKEADTALNTTTEMLSEPTLSAADFKGDHSNVFTDLMRAEES